MNMWLEISNREKSLRHKLEKRHTRKCTVKSNVTRVTGGKCWGAVTAPGTNLQSGEVKRWLILVRFVATERQEESSYGTASGKDCKNLEILKKKKNVIPGISKKKITT